MFDETTGSNNPHVVLFAEEIEDVLGRCAFDQFFYLSHLTNRFLRFGARSNDRGGCFAASLNELIEKTAINPRQKFMTIPHFAPKCSTTCWRANGKIRAAP